MTSHPRHARPSHQLRAENQTQECETTAETAFASTSTPNARKHITGLTLFIGRSDTSVYSPSTFHPEPLTSTPPRRRPNSTLLSCLVSDAAAGSALVRVVVTIDDSVAVTALPIVTSRPLFSMADNTALHSSSPISAAEARADCSFSARSAAVSLACYTSKQLTAGQ